MDTTDFNGVKQRRSRLGKKIVLAVIAAVLVHLLALASVAMPLFRTKAPAYLMEQGDYATAYRVAWDSEKNSILAECMTIQSLDEFSAHLYHPSSLNIIGGYYTMVSSANEEKDVCSILSSIKYSALSKSGTANNSSWEILVGICALDIPFALRSYDDDDGDAYQAYQATQKNKDSNNATKMSRDQLERINKRAAAGTLGEITPIPAECIDTALLPKY